MTCIARPRRRSLRRIGTIGGAGVVALLLHLVSGAPAGAQETGDDCHCVDRDGERIEDCVCLSVAPPRAMGFVAPFARRAVIGVTIDYEQAAEVDGEGARIQEVRPDGPADRAGLRTGDVVVGVDGRSVFDPLDRADERRLSESRSLPVQRFVRLVGALEPGEPAEIEFRRDGETRTATLTPEPTEGLGAWSLMGGDGPEIAWRFDGEGLAERLQEGLEGARMFRFEGPGERGEVRVFGEPGPEPGERFFGRLRDDPCTQLSSGDRGGRVFVIGGADCIDGVEFIALNPELGEYFGTTEGVLVARVAEASSLGLRGGDVLQAIDGREVRTPEHARRILRSYETDEEVRLRVLRQGAETEVLGRRR